MATKKKFKDTGVGKFLLEKIPAVVGSLADDTPIGNVVRTLIGGSEMSDSDKAIALKKLEQEIHEFDGITKRWVADFKKRLATTKRKTAYINIPYSCLCCWLVFTD